MTEHIKELTKKAISDPELRQLLADVINSITLDDFIRARDKFLNAEKEKFPKLFELAMKEQKKLKGVT